MPTKKKATVLAKPGFEQALGELEKLTEAIESGEMPLEEVVVAYERGCELIAMCRKQLGSARAKIKQLNDDSLILQDDVDD